MASVFVSHSSADRALVENEIVAFLTPNGIRVWYSPADIATAEEWEAQIREGLRQCEWFLVVLTPHAIASRWVSAEVHWAMDERAGRVIPLIAGKCDWRGIHLMMRTVQAIDYLADPDEGKRKLLDVFRDFRGSPSSGTVKAQAITTPTAQARHMALATVREQMMRSIQQHPEFKVLADAAGSEYVLEFHAPSLAPPPPDSSEPIPINFHRVLIRFPPTFPEEPPAVSWLTPIFHPSIDPVDGRLVLPHLLKGRQISMERLCQLLLDLATFQNYPLDGCNPSAVRWLTTPTGQSTIQQMNGNLLHQRIDAGSPDRRKRMQPLRLQ
jgi:ubiquitin-protein ligase